LVQQEQVLAEVDGLPAVIAMGDFNFEPDTEQYRLTRETLEDAWLVKWPSGSDDQGYNPADRIDHVFISPGLQVLEARHIQSSASDHPVAFDRVKPTLPVLKHRS
jgi:endonuclease/exonuclease/phosphatase family metal-dependent hydrolase